ncbi:MAG: DnaJ C-terminal domain-containing protein [Candidatus Woesearchaeota archaeon]
MDLYKELGVDKNATNEEIKKAYKKLAMKHHPDRGGDAAKLSKINEAYNILKNPQKRAEYDNPSFRFNNGTYRTNVDDIFADMFNQRGFGFSGFYGGQRQKANKKIQVRTVITIKDAFVGKQFTASLQLPSGKVEEIDVNIPPGVISGDVIHVRGAGDDTYSDLPRGDVYVEVLVKPEPGWDIHGHDILTSKQVSVFELMTGTSIEIKAPNDKKIKLNVPAGTQINSVLSIKGYGLPYPKSNKHGNIHVKIDSFIPKVVSDEGKVKLKELENEINNVSK